MSTASEVNDEGFISYLGPADYEHSIELLRESGEQLIALQGGEFLIPTFNDLLVTPATTILLGLADKDFPATFTPHSIYTQAMGLTSRLWNG